MLVFFGLGGAGLYMIVVAVNLRFSLARRKINLPNVKEISLFT